VPPLARPAVPELPPAVPTGRPAPALSSPGAGMLEGAQANGTSGSAANNKREGCHQERIVITKAKVPS
jgi:hypothetical protein